MKIEQNLGSFIVASGLRLNPYSNGMKIEQISRTSVSVESIQS